MSTIAPAIVTSKTEQTVDKWDDYSKKIPDFIAHKNWLDGKLAERRTWLKTWAWPRYAHDKAKFDMRTPAEQRTGSRPFYLDPQAFATIQAIATKSTADLLAVSPTFGSRGRGVEDQAETEIERIVNYDFTELNPLSEWAEEHFERACVQGLNILSLRHVYEATEIDVTPQEWDQRIFNEAVARARKFGLGPSPTDPAEFAEWRAEAYYKSEGRLRVPMPPVGRKETLIRRCGPIIRHEDLTGITWDVAEPTIEYQPVIYKAGLFQREFLLAEAERRPDIWDAEAIRRCPQATAAGKTGAQILEAYLTSIKVKADLSNDPYFKDAIHVIQRFAPFESGVRYCAIGNESVALTVDPEKYIYDVPLMPFFGMQNIRTPGASVGISEYEPASSVYEHLDAIQSQKLYWQMLQLFQPIAVETEAMALALQNIEPGKPLVLPTGMLDQYRLLFEGRAGRSMLAEQPVMADNAIAALRQLSDVASGVYGPGRGEPAQINRVTGAEFMGRQEGGDVRMRARLWKFAVMTCQHMIPFGLALRYQFSDPEKIANIAGGDPFAMLHTDSLLEAIQSNYSLAAGAVDPNAPLRIQQLRELMKAAGEAGVLKPGGKAAKAFFIEQARALRVTDTASFAQLIEADLKEDEQEALQKLQQQVEQLAQQLEAVQRENDALRRRLIPPIPPAAVLNAEMQAMQGPPPGPNGGPPPPGPPGGPPPEEAM